MTPDNIGYTITLIAVVQERLFLKAQNERTNEKK